MKTFKNNGKTLGYLLALAWVAGGSAQADIVTPATEVQNFIFTTSLTAAPLDPLPAINGTWSILPWTGLPTTLQCVTLEITTKVVYSGTLFSQIGNQSFLAQVRGDFSLDFPVLGPTPSQAALDPVVIINGTAPATPWTPFDLGGMDSPTTTVTLSSPAELDQYRSGSPVPVNVTGVLKTTTPGGTFVNTSDLGPASPAAFVNSPKVFPGFGLQLYKLETTLKVTYFVPETQAPMAALLGLGVGWYLLRRRAIK